MPETRTGTNEDLFGKVALIDGDIFVYRCAAAAEKTYYKVETSQSKFLDAENYREAKKIVDSSGGIIWSRKEVQPLEHALHATKTAINNVIELIKPSQTRIYLSGKRNFRNDIAVTNPYKDNRPERPKHYRAVRDYLTERGAITTDGIEADDAIGIDATRLGGECVIVTNDKDLDQISGWHFNWTTNGVYWVSPKDGAFAFYSQVISGDATDTVVGIPGVGPKGAAKILEGATGVRDLYERAWGAYLDHYGDIGLTGDDLKNYFHEQINLVYILRKEGERWKPPV